MKQNKKLQRRHIILGLVALCLGIGAAYLITADNPLPVSAVLPGAEQHPEDSAPRTNNPHSDHARTALPSHRQQHTAGTAQSFRNPSAATPSPSPGSQSPAATNIQNTFELTSASPQSSRLTFRTPAYRVRTVQEDDGRKYSIVDTDSQHGRIKKKGYPEVPAFRTDVVIPANVTPRLKVTSVQYTEISAAPPLPSPGFVKRSSAGGKAAARSRDESFYGGKGTFPESVARLTECYNIRDVRGVGILVYPFQYSADRKKLRIYSSIRIEVQNTNGADARPDLRFSGPFKTLPFRRFYERRFINHRTAFSRSVTDTSQETSDDDNRSGDEQSPAIATAGSLLVISPGAFSDAVMPFIQWKRQRGLTVRHALYPEDTGSGSDNLADYIQSQYDQNDTVYVVLAGDADDIPVAAVDPNPTDMLYSLVSGDDLYHDLLISRLPAGTAADLTNMVDKIVQYEKNPAQTASLDWYKKALFVGSDEGASKSAFGMDDRDILDAERDVFLAGNFDTVTQVYEPEAIHSDVVQAWNDGRSIVYYLGHGTETQWNTTGFGVSSVRDSLNNGRSLPFVLNGNCENGNFTWDGGDCLAEAMIKAGDTGSPAGAVSVAASTTDMDWDPPIWMMRNFAADYDGDGSTYHLTGSTVPSVGAITVFSIQDAMDWCFETPGEGETAAGLIMEQMHLLGDATMDLRTSTPYPIQVDHPTVAPADTTFSITVTTDTEQSVPGATVCLYHEDGTQITGTTDETGAVDLDTSGLDPSLEDVFLTVYTRKTIPYQTTIPVQPDELTILSEAVLPPAYLDEPYQFTHSAGGGEEPYSWSTSGDKPAWGDLDATTGELTGEPDTVGTFSYTLHVEDAAGAEASQAITLAAGRAPMFDDSPVPPAGVDEVYAHHFTTGATFEPVRFSKISGALPDGLQMAEDGELSGTPTLAGTYQFTIEATDAHGRSAEKAVTLTVEADEDVNIVNELSLPDGQLGRAYAVDFSADGGTGSGFTWSVASGTLPEGLSLRDDGQLRGTPTDTGTYMFTVRAEDNADPSYAVRKLFRLHVDAALYFTAGELPAAVKGLAYNTRIPVTGSATPFSFTTGREGSYDQTTTDADFTRIGEKRWQTDETEWPLDFGFEFPFFGQPYTSCQIGDNGYVLLSNQSPDPKWEATPENFEERVMIAPMWTDLAFPDDAPETGIFVEQEPDAVTIRWCGRDYHEQEHPLNFSVRLQQDGVIVFRYGAITTTNRVVIGISNGTAAECTILATHSWDEAEPIDFTGWSEHDNVVFQIPQQAPDWLAVTDDGTIGGVPPSAGDYTFLLSARDARGNRVSREFTLRVNDNVTPDIDSNGTISNEEILDYVDLYVNGAVSETEIQNAVDAWRSQAPRRGDTGESDDSSQDYARPQDIRKRIGRISIVDVDIRDKSELNTLITEDFNIASFREGKATLYVTDAELETLTQSGYDFRITGHQYVGAEAETRRSGRGVPAGYRNYEDIQATLDRWQIRYPHLCRVVSIGTSVNGKDIRAIKITDNPAVDEREPEYRYVGAIHGDEPASSEMVLDFAEMLLTQYGDDTVPGRRLTTLVDNAEIWLLPCMNPDGMAAGTRFNASGVDLNRAFPDRIASSVGNVLTDRSLDVKGLPPEAAAVMNWSRQHRFVLSGNLHTGALGVVYPYGNNATRQSTDTPTPDDAVFERLSAAYVQRNTFMRQESSFPDGVSNAAAWFLVQGEMPDWNYTYLSTLGVTIELDTRKSPPASELAGIRENNMDAMLSFLEDGGATGIKGVVRDEDTTEALRAEIIAENAGQPVYTDRRAGDYHRVLTPGNYDLTTRAPGYWAHSLRSLDIADGQIIQRDISLEPAPHSLTRRFSPGTDFPQTGRITVNLDVDIAGDEGADAWIVTERIPPDCEYVQGSTVNAVTGASLPEPRIHDGYCSWLFRGEDRGGQAFEYTVSAQHASRSERYFSGKLTLSEGTMEGAGLRTWQRPEAMDFTLHLEEGWNLVSLPLYPENSARSAILSDESIWAVWEWAPGEGYKVPQDIKPGSGYWIYAGQRVTLEITGVSAANLVTSYEAGWNLIGPASEQSLPVTDGVDASVWRWQAEGQYTLGEEFMSGHGYWLFADESGQMMPE